MNAASDILTQSIDSTFRPSNCLESDESSSDCFNQSIYEFRDIEELASLRNLGYSKPKHMWILKDQALSGVAEISNISTYLPADRSNSISNPFCSNIQIDHVVEKSDTSTSYLTTDNSTTQSSPVLSDYLPGSVAIASQQADLGMLLSVHADNNRIARTPSLSMESKGKSSPNLNLNPIMQDVSQSNIEPIIPSDKEFIQEKAKTTSNRLITEHPETLDSNKLYENTAVLNLEPLTGSKSPYEPNILQTEAVTSQQLNTSSVKHVKTKSHSYLRRKRAQKKASSFTAFKPSMSSSSTSRTSSLTSSSAESLSHQNDNDCDITGSPPVSSCFGVGGLKIRLRRDSAPIDIPVNGRKRTKAKHDSAGTFRIVESWCDTDAPGGDFSQRFRTTISNGSLPSSSISSSSSSPSLAITNGSLRVGDIVWAKLAGYPYWPSRISAIWARTTHQLSQACTPMPTVSTNSSTSSLAVMATPSDSSLASGYTARVEWIAWDQCSYLSCAKLFPFLDAYDKLYSPRTRVKGYADAIRLAKQYVTQMSSSMVMSQERCFSPVLALTTATTTTPIQTPAHNDSHWSTSVTALSCSSSEPLSSLPSIQPPNSREPVDSTEVDSGLITPQAQHSISNATGNSNNSSSLDAEKSSIEQNQSQPPGVLVSELDFLNVAVDSLTALSTEFNLPCGGASNTASWAPLPQLDISGFGDFVSHVPTFSEDEDDEDIGQQLELDLEF